MSNWLGTNSGKVIDLSHPDPSQIDIADIADGLSKICRFNGQIKQFYSVAEHSLNVMSMLPTQYQLVGLLHDAAEAYLCDIPTPLKRELGEAYADIERRVNHAISAALCVDIVNLPEAVRQADLILCVSERDAFVRQPRQWPDQYENAPRFPNLRAGHLDHMAARNRFLAAYAQLTEREAA